jgi:hypothetical protein
MKTIFTLILSSSFLHASQVTQTATFHYLVDKPALDAWQWEHDQSTAIELHSQVLQFLKEGKAREVHASWAYTHEDKSLQFRHGTEISYPTAYQSAGALAWPIPTDLENRFIGYDLRQDTKRCEQIYSDMNLPQASYYLPSQLSAQDGDRFIPNVTELNHQSSKLPNGIHLLKQVDAQGVNGPIGKYHLVFLQNTAIDEPVAKASPMPQKYQVHLRNIRVDELPVKLINGMIATDHEMEKMLKQGHVMEQVDGSGSGHETLSLNRLREHIEPRSWFGGYESSKVGTREIANYQNGEEGVSTQEIVLLKKNKGAKARCLPQKFDPVDIGLACKITPLTGEDAGWLNIDFQRSTLSKDVVLRRVEIDGKWEPDCIIHDVERTEWKCTSPVVIGQWVLLGAVRQDLGDDGKSAILACFIKVQSL